MLSVSEDILQFLFLITPNCCFIVHCLVVLLNTKYIFLILKLLFWFLYCTHSSKTKPNYMNYNTILVSLALKVFKDLGFHIDEQTDMNMWPESF